MSRAVDAVGCVAVHGACIFLSSTVIAQPPRLPYAPAAQPLQSRPGYLSIKSLVPLSSEDTRKTIVGHSLTFPHVGLGPGAMSVFLGDGRFRLYIETSVARGKYDILDSKIVISLESAYKWTWKIYKDRSGRLYAADGVDAKVAAEISTSTNLGREQ